MTRKTLALAIIAGLSTLTPLAAQAQTPPSAMEVSKVMKLIGRYRSTEGTILNATLSGHRLSVKIAPDSPIKLGHEYEVDMAGLNLLKGKRYEVKPSGRWEDGDVTVSYPNVVNSLTVEGSGGPTLSACKGSEPGYVYDGRGSWVRLQAYAKGKDKEVVGANVQNVTGLTLTHNPSYIWVAVEQQGRTYRAEGPDHTQPTTAPPCGFWSPVFSFWPAEGTTVAKLVMHGKELDTWDVTALRKDGASTSRDAPQPAPSEPAADHPPPSAPPPPVVSSPSIPTGPSPAPGTGVLHPAGASSYQNYGVWDFKVDELSQGPDGHWQAVFMARAAASHRIGMVSSEIKLFLINEDGEVVVNWGELYKASVTGPSLGLEKVPGTLWMEKGDQARVRVRWDKSRHFKPVKLRMQSTGAGAVVRTFPIN